MSVDPAALASPCTGVCRLDPATQHCDGCARTIDEIAAWGTLDDAGRRAVLAALPTRRRVTGGVRQTSERSGDAPAT